MHRSLRSDALETEPPTTETQQTQRQGKKARKVDEWHQTHTHTQNCKEGPLMINALAKFEIAYYHQTEIPCIPEQSDKQ
eukprot:1130472-Amphidinium_carterae.1